MITPRHIVVSLHAIRKQLFSADAIALDTDKVPTVSARCLPESAAILAASNRTVIANISVAMAVVFTIFLLIYSSNATAAGAEHTDTQLRSTGSVSVGATPCVALAGNETAPAPESDSQKLPLHGLSDEGSLSNRMELERPSLKALISVTDKLDPFQLDAQSSQTISLADILKQAIEQNLEIKIRREDLKAKQWQLRSACGQFLPNVNLGYRYQYLKGTLNLPFGGADNIRLNSPLIVANAGYSYYLFRGGKIISAVLQNRNYYKASKHQQHASINDVLFEAATRYHELVLSEAQLQIRIKAVERSEDQLKLDQDLLEGGMATMLDVLQARTQLASDRQALIDQQIARRNAAITLGEYVNLNQEIDLVPGSRILRRTMLVADNFTPAVLVATAIKNRPELKQYEELRLAAKKSIAIAAAPLLPTFQTFGTVYGIGETLSNASKTSLNPISLSGGSFGQPIRSIVIPHQVSRQIKPLYVIGYQAQWNFSGLGATDSANIQSARHQARQAMLQATQQLNLVTRQARQSYLNTLSTNRKIEETVARVESSAEELRLAQLRFKHGVGKNIDVVKAQQDYTTALIDNSQALINYNIAQAQLLHDLGIISINNLTAIKPASLFDY